MLIREFDIADIPKLKFTARSAPAEIVILPTQDAQKVRVEIEGPRMFLKQLRLQQLEQTIAFFWQTDGSFTLRHKGSWLSIKPGEGMTVTGEGGELSITGVAQVMVDGKICAEDTPDPLVGEPLRIKVYAPRGAHLDVDLGAGDTLQSQIRLGDVIIDSTGSCQIGDMQGNLTMKTSGTALTECHGTFTSVSVDAHGASKVVTSGEITERYEVDIGASAKVTHTSPRNSRSAPHCIVAASGESEASYEGPQLASAKITVGGLGKLLRIRSAVLGDYDIRVWGDAVAIHEGEIHGKVKFTRQHDGQFIHKESSDVSPIMIS